MAKTEFHIQEIQKADFNSLRPLVEEFISTHPSFSFRTNYWDSFCDWLSKGLKDENILSLRATINYSTVGFIVGVIQDNGALQAPERLGYVSIMVVDRKHRKIGIGNALWKELRNWFSLKGITYFELYTEIGNSISGPFWKNRGFNAFVERRRQHIEDFG